MAKCKNCGKPIETVQVNFFNPDGSDSYCECAFEGYDNGCIELDVDQEWTGNDLSYEERKETIRCPHCGKFPFADEMTVYDIVRVIMFEEEEDETE